MADSVAVVKNLTELQEEAARQMTVCNACRYCEGICAVFPAMELRRQMTGADVDYLASLCHSCGACYYDCQYAPPHEFAISVPVAMSELREDSYARYAWPAFLAPMFRSNGLKIAITCSIAVAVFLIGFIFFTEPAVLFASGDEPGSFYRAMPHNVMALIFGVVFLFALIAMAMSVRQYWVATGSGGSLGWRNAWQAAKDAASLRYLDGGGMGCMHKNETPSNARRLFHHFTFYGFLLCLLSTSSGTVMHYIFSVQAPYPYWSPTVVLGTLGGIGLVIGPVGLLRARRETDPGIKKPNRAGMDTAFLVMLLLTSVTGLILLVLRSTPAMGILLAIHLGVVFALFLTMPYGKFVHGLFRYAALMRHAHEQRAKA